MRRRDVVDLVLLAMLWGASFLFMRIAVPEFGPVALVEMRVAVAALLLFAMLVKQGDVPALVANWRPLAVVGFVNSVIPFTLFAYAMLALTAGFGAILNSTAPLFTAVIAYLWLKERLPWMRVAGLFVGVAGVVLLVVGKPSFSLGGDGWAIAAALFASVTYGVAPNYTRRALGSVPSLVIATGSQVAAALIVAPFAVFMWPATTPSTGAWGAALLLGIASTGLAYALFFRLIQNVGPTRAVAVTFLIPIFGMLWGMLFLDESVTLNMILGCVVILAGTALTTGLVGARARP